MPHLRVRRILAVIVCGFLCIFARVWLLSTVQRERMTSLPGRRTLFEHVERGPILDRFHIPLATNSVVYNASIQYADIAKLPRVQWIKGATGKRERRFARLAYIRDLAQMLAHKLQVSAVDIEDLIHAKAALFPHTSFVVKANIPEKEYAWLKVAEKDWPGLRAEKGSVRVYPGGRTAAHVVGYMGAINAEEYRALAQERRDLRAYLAERDAGSAPILVKGFQDPLEVRERLAELEEKMIAQSDDVGKMGVELAYDRDLRGYVGKQQIEVDFKGNVLRPLPGAKHPISGETLTLSISAELQEYAEQLLAEHEALREERHADKTPALSSPWIRGGAIVALDPHTGEVLALASYPRFDPNDFVHKTPAVTKWLENGEYVRAVWEGRKPLERERFDEKRGGFYDETCPLTWDRYLEAILSKESRVIDALQRVGTVRRACEIYPRKLKTWELDKETPRFFRPARGTVFENTALVQDEKSVGQPTRSKTKFSVSLGIHSSALDCIPCDEDKMLAMDLCRLVVPAERFSPELLECIGDLSLKEFFALTQEANALLHALKAHVRSAFRSEVFAPWREAHFKDFLKQKRADERAKKRYARPYTDYLEMQEKTLFDAFWKEHRYALLHAWVTDSSLYQNYVRGMPKVELLPLKKMLLSLVHEEGIAFLRTIRGFDELQEPLLGTYPWGTTLQDLARAFYPTFGYSCCRSYAYRQAAPQGSVFKVAIAYQALLERYRSQQTADLNPLTIYDERIPSGKKRHDPRQILGRTLDGNPIRRLYKGGLLPRSPRSMGKLDLARAIEQSSNTYFSLIAARYLNDPSPLLDTVKALGFGAKTGIDLPGEHPGSLPDDLHLNPTGLYTFAIGQHSLLVTPLQTAMMLSALANGGKVLRPTTLSRIAGKAPIRWDEAQYHHPPTLFKDPLHLIGVPFALFAGAEPPAAAAQTWEGSSELVRTLDMPSPVRHYLLRAMHRVTTGENGTARPKIIRSLSRYPAWRKAYHNLHERICGKTGTAEFMYKHTIDAASTAKMHNHVWFGGIVFADGKDKTPELVVVAHLRFSKGGSKEAAPLVAAMAHKWREIQAKHQDCEGGLLHNAVNKPTSTPRAPREK